MAIAALALTATAFGLGALSLSRSASDGPEAAATAARELRVADRRNDAPARRTAPEPDPLPLPSQRSSWDPRRESIDRRPAPTQPTSNTAAEPQWDGRGLPNREWLRWQLETVVAQAHPLGSISYGALESAIDDALELKAARLDLEAAKDPSRIAAAQARFERAAQDLATNLGIEGLDFSAF